jgi:hypothetical protein
VRRSALDEQLALVVAVHAREDLDERRLAGTVVTEDARHLAGVDTDADVLQRDDVAEVLRHVAHLEQRLVLGQRAVGLLGGHRRAPSARLRM